MTFSTLYDLYQVITLVRLVWSPSHFPALHGLGAASTQCICWCLSGWFDHHQPSYFYIFIFIFFFWGGGCSCTVSKLFISYGFLKGHATVIIMSYNDNKAILFYSILFIHCDTWVEHMQWVAVVLESLRQMGLTVNLKTSAVGWREVQHLGHQLEKIQCVADSVRYYLLVCPFTLWAVGSPVIHHTNYTLPISVAAGPGGESCVVWVSCRGQLKSCM